MDEHFRSLERAVRAAPADLALGSRLAHALMQSGNRRRAFREYGRLARLGDPGAGRVVETWAPRPHGLATSSTRRSMTKPRIVRRRKLSRLSLVGRPPIASEDRLVVAAAGRTVAVDLETLAVAWEEPIWGLPVVLGDDVLHIDREGDLVLRDARNGAVLAGASGLCKAKDVAAVLDRVVVIDELALNTYQARAFALEEHGLEALPWRVDGPRSVHPVGPYAVLVGWDRLDVVSIDSGKTEGSCSMAPIGGDGPHFEQVKGTDQTGLLIVGVAKHDPSEVGTTVVERSLPKLDVKWRFDVTGQQAGACFAGHRVLVLVHGYDQGPDRLLLLDRATGRLLRESVLAGVASHQPVAVDPSTIYVVAGDPELRFLILDAETLEVRYSEPLGVRVSAVFAQDPAEIVVLDDAAVITCPGPSRLELIRLTSADATEH